MENDKIIISKVLNGDGNAFGEIIERYNNRILSFICKMGINSEDSQDIAQEVFIKAYNNLYRYNKNWEFSTWLFTIAVNTAKDLFKSRKSTPHYTYNIPSVTNDYNCEEHLSNIELREFIREMFEILEDDAKTMLILFYFEDLPIKEIAGICNTKYDVVKMKIHRARKKLCDQFSKRWDGECHV